MDLGNLIKAWDLRWVWRECWSSCEKGFGSKYMTRVNEDEFPVYRDPQSLTNFLVSARHFECNGVCESDYFYKRLVVALPTLFTGLVFVLGCLCCYFCKDRLINKLRKRKGSKTRLSDSASSLTVSTATTISVIENLKNEVGGGGNESFESNSKSWVIDDRDGRKQQGRSGEKAKNVFLFARRKSNDDKYKKPRLGKRSSTAAARGMNSSTTSPSTSSVQTIRDMKGESMKSATSINSWMEESANGKVTEASNKSSTLPSAKSNQTMASNQSRKPSKSLLNTTARLGRKLIALDLESEERAKPTQKRKQLRRHKSSN